MNTKTCTKCGIEKPLSEFNKEKTGKFGVRGDCKECLKSPRTKKHNLVPEGFRLCTNCDKIKPLSEFYKADDCKFKVRGECKTCSYIYSTYNYNKNKFQILNKHKNWSIKYPWKRIFTYISQRCNNPKSTGYSYYGGRGILCLLTVEDVKTLWFRDKAYEMKKPHIHRINNDGNYCVENCVFIESSEHSKIHKKKI